MTTITLQTAPSPQVSCHAIEEQIPAGWKVTAISDGGIPTLYASDGSVKKS